MSKPETLLILMPWEPSVTWISSLPEINPGIKVIYHKTKHGAYDIPDDVPAETWNATTVLFTWRAFPPPELVPNLQYVQLLSAGANHILEKDLFAKTDVAFCTCNGVHP